MRQWSNCGWPVEEQPPSDNAASASATAVTGPCFLLVAGGGHHPQSSHRRGQRSLTASVAQHGITPAGPADPADLGGKLGTWYQRDITAEQGRDGPAPG